MSERDRTQDWQPIQKALLFQNETVIRLKNTDLTPDVRVKIFEKAPGIEQAEVLVVYVIPPDEEDPQSLRKLAGDILRAVGYDTDLADFLELSSSRFTLRDIRPEPYRYILSFGANPLRLGLQIDLVLYQPFQLDTTTYVWSHGLHKLKADKERKRKLWMALKQVFTTEA